MSRLIAAEFSKLATTRLWLWLLVASMAITALYAGLNIGFADNTVTYSLVTPQGQQTLFGVAAGAAKPLAAVLGAIGLTGEFRHRTATATFLASPNRGRVIAAKLATYGVVGAAYGVASTLVVATAATIWLPAKGVDISLTANGLPATMIGGVVAVAIYGLIGVGLGALARDQVATVVGMLIYLYVVETIVTEIPALGDWTIYLPGPAASALSGISLTTRDFLPAWQGGLLLAGYGMVFALAGNYLTMRRDIA
jgi:ABC-2 type transport system permease protein